MSEIPQKNHPRPTNIVIQISDLCKQIRKEVVPLVDSFNLPDSVINSPFGRYDGQIFDQKFFSNNKKSNAFIPNTGNQITIFY